MHKFAAFGAAVPLTGMAAGSASAGQPEPWGLGFQEAVTPTMENISWFHDVILMPVITVITLFVLGLMAYAIWRFRESRNPEPSRTTHNTVIEVLWTAIPTVILVLIAIPSFRIMYENDRIEQADMTLKTIGRQWYWSYQYPDHGDFEFDSNIIPDEEIDPSKGQLRQLSVDNPVYLPVNQNIRVLFTSSDVLHAWALPAAGVKLDNVPGRINETWMRIEKEGVYYGQCSELCGTGHGYMPIEVRAVSQEAFDAWVEKAREEYAKAGDAPADEAPVRVAGLAAAR